MRAFSLRGVSKRLGEVKAVESVWLDLQAGSRTAIIGPSGSGKTTLLRLIAGLEMPDGGEVWLGETLASRPGFLLPPRQRGVGFVFQSSALWPHLTVAQNIAFGLDGLAKSDRRHVVSRLLDQLGLSGLGGRYPSQLSGGQARRAALARTLAPRPAITLLDEPLTHMEAELKAQVLEVILNAVAETGSTLVYVTHDLEEAEQLGGQGYQMTGGPLH